MDNSLSLFFDAWPLFQNSVLSGVIAGAMLGMLGVYVVIRRMVFLSAALAQVSGLGVALAFYLQVVFGVGSLGGLLSPTVGALALSLLVILGMNVRSRKQNDSRDAQLGLIFLLGSAGALVIGTRIVQELNDIQSLLFGTAVAVLDTDFYLLVAVGCGLVILHAVWNRAFSSVSLDPIGAQVRGLPVRAIDTILLISLAVGISFVTRILGALPAFAFSVLPPMAALAVSRNVTVALFLSALLGALAGFVGYLMAYLYDLPVGASQTLVAIGFVALFKTYEALRNRG